VSDLFVIGVFSCGGYDRCAERCVHCVAVVGAFEI